jgi:CRISPR-associated endonuclease/helicase Cas3
MPEDARDLIEGVYGDGAEAAIPAALLARSYRVAGHNSAKQTVAAVNVIRLEDGYVDQGFDPWDDALTPTRLEDSPSVTVRLARWENGEARPWIDAGRYSWELSQLSVRVSLLSEEIPETDPALQKAVAQCKGAMPDHGNYSRLLVLRMDGEIGCGRARNRKGETVELAYDQRQGLRRTGQERSLPGPPDSASKS